MLFVINYISDQYETKEMCDKVIIGNGGMLKYFELVYSWMLQNSKNV